ncbi:MAG: RAMP superfamily CRISPR-associated protein [Armatimonadota bacterium]|nr:RAMP superfamily CRISPR-associated protein [Armatimonadota bacterium]
MASLEITLELVTPAYAGGAETSQCDGLRPPVLKAMLRFWWRTLFPHLPPEELFKREEQLFGSTRVGQGLRVVPLQNPADVEIEPEGQRLQPGTAFLSYGVSEWDKSAGRFVTNRRRARAGQSTAFRLQWGARLPEGAETELVKTLWLLSAFGGWGTKARRGWGSVRVQCSRFGEEANRQLPDPHGTRQQADLVALLLDGLHSALGPREKLPARPAHTAFSRNARLLVGKGYPDANAALDAMGSLYNRYRRALGARRGHGPDKVGPDHQQRSGWLERGPQPTDRAPLGSAFGLPHLATFSNGAKVDVGVGKNLSGRRASPLFFKVLRCGEGCVPVVLWLPARFLPDGEHIFVRTPAAEQEVQPPDETGIEDFLDGRLGLQCFDAESGSWTGLTQQGWEEVAW